MRQLDDGNIVLKWLVILIDIAVFNVYLYLVSTAWCWNCVNTQKDLDFSLLFYVGNVSMLVAEINIKPVINRYTASFNDVITRSLKLGLVQWLSFFVMLLLIPRVQYSLEKSVVYSFGFFVILQLLSLLQFVVIRKKFWSRYNGKSSVFVGDIHQIEQVAHTFINGLVYRVNGYYADSEVSESDSMTRLGSVSDFISMTQTELFEHRYEAVYCTVSLKNKEQIESIQKYCDNTTTRLYFIPPDAGTMDIKLKPELLCGKVIYTNHEFPLDSISNQSIKRLFDIAVSFIACLFILPLVPFVGLIIKIQSPGPIFFRQERTGLNGQTFRLMKFRSMHVNKDADRLQATSHDARKFAWGSFMRKTSIDELPQFFNVLKGDMSIVGPRPHMLKHTEMYGKLIDRYMSRHFVKPGITGLAQVTGFRGETKELWQMEDRVKMDCFYIKNWKFGLDLRIIFMTIAQVFKDDKAY
jgi:putative colanic acid biosynthesis UDP-glucose lipid carrier transferase